MCMTNDDARMGMLMCRNCQYTIDGTRRAVGRGSEVGKRRVRLAASSGVCERDGVGGALPVAQLGLARRPSPSPES